MPAGTSWPRYLMAGLTSLLFMFAGAQTVHMFYRPLQDLEMRVQEVQKVKKERLEDSSAHSSPS